MVVRASSMYFTWYKLYRPLDGSCVDLDHTPTLGCTHITHLKLYLAFFGVRLPHSTTKGAFRLFYAVGGTERGGFGVFFSDTFSETTCR